MYGSLWMEMSVQNFGKTCLMNQILNVGLARRWNQLTASRPTTF